MRNYEADVRRAMTFCSICTAYNHDQASQERHLTKALEQILRTQTRKLTPLPASAWPLGRPWKP